MLKNPMRDRVVSRLNELGMTPTSDAIRQRLHAENLDPNYLYEFIIGKKNALRQSKLPAVARVLQTTPDALSGDRYVLPPAVVPAAGICEEGAWRAVQPDLTLPASIPVNNRYPVENQHAYLVIGTHAESFGVADKSVLVCVSGVAPRLGDVVIVRRRNSAGDTEFTARRFDGNTLFLPSGVIESSRAEVVGTVVMQIRTFS
jgi:hypothetical protein